MCRVQKSFTIYHILSCNIKNNRNNNNNFLRICIDVSSLELPSKIRVHLGKPLTKTPAYIIIIMVTFYYYILFFMHDLYTPSYPADTSTGKEGHTIEEQKSSTIEQFIELQYISLEKRHKSHNNKNNDNNNNDTGDDDNELLLLRWWWCCLWGL